MRYRPGHRALVAALAGMATLAPVLALTACGPGSGEPRAGETGASPSREPSPAQTRATPSPTSSSSTATTATSSPTVTETPEPATCGQRLAAWMSPREKAGQLLMVGLDSAASPSALASQVRAQGLGGVVLLGSWLGSAAVSSAAHQLQASAPQQAGLLIAADQEGGQVQRLAGAGFSTIPSARDQGTTGVRTEEHNAAVWAAELAKAGVNLNLAPVADTVPADLGSANAPIGGLARDFVPGSPDGNGRYVAAFVRGSRASGVATTLKHFPGLGRVTGNTDNTASGIVDDTTTADDSYLGPFRSGIEAGAPLVMASSATYTRIDPANPAMFSREVLTGLLREKLGFDGVVISDDVGVAAAVANVPVGDRAVRFVASGGDIVLTAVPGQASTMIEAILTRSRARPAFAEKLDLAAGRVLDLKVGLGLARC